MRELVEHAPPGDLEFLDGIKVIRPDGWTLVLPDPEDPLTHVWAEGETANAAGEFAAEAVEAIRKALQ
jgi:mannose-1-phosphate guanylyltransferase/phosphomannomutase